MSWDVTLYCNACQTNVGTLRDIMTNKPDETGAIRRAMREHLRGRREETRRAREGAAQEAHEHRTDIGMQDAKFKFSRRGIASLMRSMNAEQSERLHLDADQILTVAQKLRIPEFAEKHLKACAECAQRLEAFARTAQAWDGPLGVKRLEALRDRLLTQRQPMLDFPAPPVKVTVYDCGCTMEPDAHGTVYWATCPTHAAAPEMLETLEALVPILESVEVNDRMVRMWNWENVAGNVRTTIRKARGA